MRPEIESLIACAKARGAEEAYRSTTRALEQVAATWDADGTLRRARASDVLAGIIYATTKAAEEAAREAAKHAPDAGWALT